MAALTSLTQGALLLTAVHLHLASCAQSGNVSMPCGEGEPFGGRCYFFSSWTVPWIHANAMCTTSYDSINTSMAVITSQEQQDWLHSRGEQRDMWIGLHKATEDGSWQWVDGTPVNYTNWQAGQPSNSSHNNCAFLSGSDGTWQEAPCHTHLYYPCATTPDTPICSGGGIFYRDRCYWLILEKARYSLYNLYLSRIYDAVMPVIVRDGDLNAFLSKLVYPAVWLGMQRAARWRRPYFWVDGTRVTFQNWVGGEEPDPKYNCAILEYGTGYWRQDDCRKSAHFFVLALPSCDKNEEGSGMVRACVDEKRVCSCVTGGYCLERRRCHCQKRFHGMVCDKAQVSVELRTKSHVDEGGTIELECHVNIPKSDYSLQVQFVREDEKAVEGALPANRTQSSGNRADDAYYEFVIHNVTAEDTGTYVCIVSTEAGSEPVTRMHSAYVRVRSTSLPEDHHHKEASATDTSGLIAGVVTLAVCCALLLVALSVVVNVAGRRHGWTFARLNGLLGD